MQSGGQRVGALKPDPRWQCICDKKKKRCDCASGYGKQPEIDPLMILAIVGTAVAVLAGSVYIATKIVRPGVILLKWNSVK